MQAEDGETVEADQATETVVETAADGPVAARGADAPRTAADEPATEPTTEPDAGPGPLSGPGPGSESALASVHALDPDPPADSGPDADPLPESDADPDSGSDSDSQSESDSGAEPSRARRPVATGIGCAALLLPLIAVLGAILCFAAGILSAATGCKPNGSALCSANGPWFAFALPLFVSPLIAAGTAIGAVTVSRHRSTWLAVGYGVVFISVIVGLASASTGSG